MDSIPIGLLSSLPQLRRAWEVTLLAVESEMAAKKQKPAEKGKRDDVAVKVDRLLADKARLVAKRRGTTLAEYVSELIRGPVDRDFAKEIKAMEGKH